MSMCIVFRVDSGLHIGNGHLMRSLALAQALTEKGANCFFLCRDFPGSLHLLVIENDFTLGLLPAVDLEIASSVNYEQWLGVETAQDIKECIEYLQTWPTMDCCIVDHYAIAAPWHQSMRTYTAQMMVIDDLANRDYDCDVLLDQTYRREANDYIKCLCKPNTQLLLGTDYALLRPEFSTLHAEARVKRSRVSATKKILISMGGVDADNMTGRILSLLVTHMKTENWNIVVVLASNSPHYAEIKQNIKQNIKQGQAPIELLSGVSDMARVMLGCDLAIGAAGSTTWERCCMGLPTLLLVSADNQKFLADQLALSGAVLRLDQNFTDNIDGGESLMLQQLRQLTKDTRQYMNRVNAALAICDGKGAERVASIINSD